MAKTRRTGGANSRVVQAGSAQRGNSNNVTYPLRAWDVTMRNSVGGLCTPPSAPSSPKKFPPPPPLANAAGLVDKPNSDMAEPGNVSVVVRSVVSDRNGFQAGQMPSTESVEVLLSPSNRSRKTQLAGKNADTLSRRVGFKSSIPRFRYVNRDSLSAGKWASSKEISTTQAPALVEADDVV